MGTPGPRAGDTFSKRHVFETGEIASIAAVLGDTNPLHHDADFAAQSRYGGLIASAGHSMGVLTSLIADHFTKTHQAVGVSFGFKLRRGIPAGADTVLEWRVVKAEPSDKHGGDIVALEGRIFDAAGTEFVTARASVLVTPA